VINKSINYYFLVLFSALPVSIIAGSSVSLANVLIIDISFLLLIFINKDFSFLKKKSVKYLFLLYIYLIFNSLISINPEIGLYRNFGFLRIILLFIAINYFFEQKFFHKKVLFFWSLILCIVIFDVFFESFTGRNLLGYGGNFGGLGGKRIVSFFKDEPIVGGYINGFFLILIGYLFNEFDKNKKNLILILSIVFLISVFLTGERSNSIKAIIGLLLFYTFLKEYQIKHKILIFIFMIFSLSILILNSQFLKLRFVDQMKFYKNTENIYFKLYNSGLEVFYDNKYFGVGNKNYRVITCDQNKKNDPNNKKGYQCSTHPHQIYFELLSEHGIIGALFIIFIFYKLVFSKILKTLYSKNYVQLGSLIYMVTTFLPLLPSGAFFGDYMLTIFAINLSIFYGISSKLNIYKK
tara:strand:- start:63 stop:1286 length:1224 start_codon:yes stop_codon:yes gene_type:complete